MGTIIFTLAALVGFAAFFNFLYGIYIKHRDGEI